jgi:hypothetical protein
MHVIPRIAIEVGVDVQVAPGHRLVNT